MKHLLIRNNGLLDLTLMKLIGASTKTNDHAKIGQFGTGLKYALSYLLRTGNQFRIFVGEEEIKFNIKEIIAGGNTMQEIFCNEQSMNITTQYGYQWNAWEILREIWCNAIDEEGAIKKVVDSRSRICGKENCTTFYIEVTEDIQKVVDAWDQYFIDMKPLYEDDKVAIYKNPATKMRLYKNHVLVDNTGYHNSYFIYDLKQCDLNELRQYRGYCYSDIGKAILNSNQKVVQMYLEMYNSLQDTKFIEKEIIEFGYNHDAEQVKKIFQGYVFLHPESTKQAKGKVVRVPQRLYDILESCGLPCEKIKIRNDRTGWYGGDGNGYNETELAYKEVQNDFLNKALKRLMRKYKCDAPFVIGAAIDKEFEIVPSSTGLVFNTELDILSDKDLEAVVVIGIMHSQSSNMYHLLKRLVKIILRSSNFKKILFGK